MPEAKQLASYGMLAFSLAFIGLPTYIYAPDYYARAFQINLADIGLTLLALRFFDAVQDPVIGWLSDRLHKARMLIIASGLLIMLVGFTMLFNPLSATITWFAISILLSTTGFSIASINFQALGGLWQVQKHERTLVTAWREAIGLFGLLLAAVLPSLVTGSLEFLWLILLPCTIIGFICLHYWHKRAKIGSPKAIANPSLRNAFNYKFFGTYFLSSFASAIPAVLVLFFINDYLQAKSFSGLFLLSYFLSAVLAMPLWQKLAKIIGKKASWLIGIVLAAVTFIWASLLTSGSTIGFFIVCLLSGSALGADLALPAAIIADRLEQTNHFKQASSYFAILNFCSKSALALATGLALPILSYLGYQPGFLTNTKYLSYAYALIPSCIKLMSALLFWWFIIKPERSCEQE